MQAKREAFDLSAGVPAVMQGGELPIEAMVKALASSSGPLSDPAKEQGRQMSPERLRRRLPPIRQAFSRIDARG